MLFSHGVKEYINYRGDIDMYNFGGEILRPFLRVLPENLNKCPSRGNTVLKASTSCGPPVW